MPNEDPPEIKDHKGPWDERVAYAIVLIPFLIAFIATLVFSVLVLTGRIPVSLQIEGSVSASLITLGILGLLGLSWLLALAKVFGLKPITWIANAARDYEG